MPVKHLQVPRYMSFLNNFDLNGEAGWYRGMNSSLYFFIKGLFLCTFDHINSSQIQLFSFPEC